MSAEQETVNEQPSTDESTANVFDELAGHSRDPGVMRKGMRVLAMGIREQRRLFSYSVLGSILYGATTVADAWVLGWATDNVIRPSFERGEVLKGAAFTAIAMFLGVAVLRAAGVIGRRLIGGIVFYRLLAEYRRRVTRKYLTLPISWHHRHPTGQLLSNANADVEATWSVMMPLPMAVGVIAMLVAAVVAMLLADAVLTLVGLTIFPTLFAVNVIYQRWLSPRVTYAQSLRGDVSAVAHESFDGALVVKSLGRESEETARFSRVSSRLRAANIEVGRIRSLFDPILEALPNIGILLVVVLGVQRVSSGAADAGDVVQVAYLFTVVAFPLRAFGWVLGELPRSVVGWNRISSVLEAGGDMRYGDRELPGSGAVRLNARGVYFGYSPRADVLRGVDFQVEPGRVVAIVGATAAGKSTLASLAARLIDPDEGAIQVDGVPIDELSHEALARAIAVVPQSTFIFDDSVRENVTLGAEASDEFVWQVLQTVQAASFVRSLPRGLDTHLGERGTSLSGGQRQRLALARALVHKPRLVIMDDATSALDPDIERRILSLLADQSARRQGPTVLVVAYRKATIALADEVLFMEEGQIAARGTHAELVERSARYAALVDAYDIAREDGS